MVAVAGIGWRFTSERQAFMTIRSRRETVTFRHPFRIRCVERISFAAYRRIATIGSVDLANAQAADASIRQ